MKAYKKWTKEEEARLLREYGKVDTKELAREMGRSPTALVQRYYELNKRGGIKPRRKSKAFKKANKCPFCGGNEINEVTTFSNNSCMQANYCLSCFHEFTEEGKLIPLLWTWEGGKPYENIF